MLKPHAVKFYNANFKIYVEFAQIAKFCVFFAAKFYGVKFLEAEFASVKFYISKPAPKIPPARG